MSSDCWDLCRRHGARARGRRLHAWRCARVGRPRTLHLALRIDDDAGVVCARRGSRVSRGASLEALRVLQRPLAAFLPLTLTLIGRTLKVDEDAVLSPPRLALAHHHARHHCAARRVSVSRRSGGRRARGGAPFLRKSGLPFFTVPMNMSPGDAPGRRFSRAPQPGGARRSGRRRVRRGGGGAVTPAARRTLDADDVQVLGARVVGAVHHRAHRKTQRHLELVAGGAGRCGAAGRQHEATSPDLRQLRGPPGAAGGARGTRTHRASSW